MFDQAKYLQMFFAITVEKVSFSSFGAKLVRTIRLILSFDIPKVIVWVILTIIYISYNFIFQSSDSKPIILYHCILTSLQWSVHIKVVFEVYLEYYWGVHSYKSERQVLNTRILFVLWNEAKEVWITWKLLILFHLKFHNYPNQSELSLF